MFATDMVSPLVAGLLAGWGVAIPLGAIGVLIVDAGMRGGFRPAAAAAAGVATADFLYAAVAAATGAAAAAVLAPYERTVQLVAASVLVGVAVYGFLALRRRAGAENPPPGRNQYLRFLALTSVNPATVAYFAALIAGLPAVAGAPAGAKLVFVLAAGFASLTWQLVLAGAGATLHHRLPSSARVWTAVLGNVLVLALALRMALDSA